MDSVHTGRPCRLTARDFAGRKLSLSAEWNTWQQVKAGEDPPLILGIGPGNITNLPQNFQQVSVGWYEDPQWLEQISSQIALPESWYQVDFNCLKQLFARQRVFFYRLNLLLAPNFWAI